VIVVSQGPSPVAGTAEKAGYVFQQAPEAGASIPEGSSVTVLYAE